MFDHLSGYLEDDDLGTDRSHIDVYIFMLQIFISEAVSGGSIEKQAKHQLFPRSIINTARILRYYFALFVEPRNLFLLAISLL